MLFIHETVNDLSYSLHILTWVFVLVQQTYTKSSANFGTKMDLE